MVTGFPIRKPTNACQKTLSVLTEIKIRSTCNYLKARNQHVIQNEIGKTCRHESGGLLCTYQELYEDIRRSYCPQVRHDNRQYGHLHFVTNVILKNPHRLKVNKKPSAVSASSLSRARFRQIRFTLHLPRGRRAHATSCGTSFFSTLPLPLF